MGRRYNEPMEEASVKLSEFCQDKGIDMLKLIENGLAGDINSLSTLKKALDEKGISYDTDVYNFIQQLNIPKKGSHTK